MLELLQKLSQQTQEGYTVAVHDAVEISAIVLQLVTTECFLLFLDLTIVAI